ncbi:MAG: sigma-54-dependent Fis family transcriptional regulator, partial [Proteobacteria bacterium]|nr:sigma-54-dependent Fis family transcriptional regulator [Pseudomonadota bacterium]
LNVVSIHAPPLGERKSDILALSNYFLEEFSKDMGKIPKSLLPEVEDIFIAYPWYGNVRELRNVIERAVIFSKGRTVDKSLLPLEMIENSHQIPEQSNAHGDGAKNIAIDTVLFKTEKQIIGEALKQTKGNKTVAARKLGISRYSLIRRLNKIQKETFKQDK